MPNALDVAKQRKLVEDLKRNGQMAKVAEERLNDMLHFMAWRAESPGNRAKRATSRSDR
jgi:hypothetical protein